jgi:hypothetical protein
VQVVPGMCRVLEVVRVGAILSGERVTLLRAVHTADEAILCRTGSIFENQRVGQDDEPWNSRVCTKPGRPGWASFNTSSTHEIPTLPQRYSRSFLVPRLIASSCAIFGSSPGGPIRQRLLLSPIDLHVLIGRVLRLDFTKAFSKLFRRKPAIYSHFTHRLLQSVL